MLMLFAAIGAFTRITSSKMISTFGAALIMTMGVLNLAAAQLIARAGPISMGMLLLGANECALALRDGTDLIIPHTARAVHDQYDVRIGGDGQVFALPSARSVMS